MAENTFYTICIVIPVHNEQDNVAKMAVRILNITHTISDCKFDLLFVDDGSDDNTYTEIIRLIDKKLPVGVIQFSKNFGHQAALEAGLAYANADAVITMDGDLQHPPEEIPKMIDAFKAGMDVVQMKRKNITQNIKGVLSLAFYSFFKLISTTPLVSNAADFRLLSSRVLQEINNAQGKGKLLRAIIPSIGFNQIHLEYVQEERKYNQPSYSFFSSYELALQTIFKFSKFPAHFSFFTGIAGLVSTVIYFALMVGGIVSNTTEATLIGVILLAVGLLFIATGILCWYLYFVLEQIRQEPTYIVKHIIYPSEKTA